MIRRHKRILLLAMTMLVLVISMTVSASATTVKATTNAAVRTKASISGKKLTTIKKGAKRTVLNVSTNTKWVKVKVNGKVGYVHTNRVKVTSGSLPKRVKLGRFKLTFYGGDTTTASGKTPRINHTIAVDPRVIKLGSKVYISGWGTYYAEDTGGAIKGNIIDIFVTSEAKANRLGVRYATVYVYK